MSAEQIRLWTTPGTSGLAPHMALVACGAEHAVRWVDLMSGEHKRSEFQRLNPFGTVPVLELDDRAVAETGAILLVIAELFPAARLLPSVGGERDLHLGWLFHAAAIHADFMTWRRTRFAKLGDETVSEAVRAWMVKRLASAWVAVEAGMSGPFLAGELYGIADLYMFMVAGWWRSRFDFAASTPRLAHAMNALSRLPFVVEVYNKHEAQVPSFLAISPAV